MHFAPWVNLTARLQRSEVKNEAQRGNIHNRRLDSSHKQKRASSTCNFIGADMELQSGVLFSPALTQCPHIPLCVCGWPLLTPPKEWPYWLQRVESRTNHQTQSDTVLFACCSSSPAVWALMWESYFDDFFFFYHRYNHMEESNTAITSIHSKHIWDAVCRMDSVWRRGYDTSQTDAFNNTLTTGSSSSSSKDTLWECLTSSITTALLLLLCFILCFLSCTHWSTCALVQAYGRPD